MGSHPARAGIMSQPRSVLEAQISALEQIVDSRREARCRELLESARRSAKSTLKQEHQESRLRVRAAIQQERKLLEEDLAATRARIVTLNRERHQKADKTRLAHAWTALREALHERWKNSDHRRRWISLLIRDALARLSGEPWQIEHPPDWNSTELSRFSSEIARHCAGKQPEFFSKEEVRAGMRVVAGGASLDGTTEGLLADSTRIEAELLAMLRWVDGRGSAS